MFLGQKLTYIVLSTDQSWSLMLLYYWVHQIVSQIYTRKDKSNTLCFYRLITIYPSEIPEAGFRNITCIYNLQVFTRGLSMIDWAKIIQYITGTPLLQNCPLDFVYLSSQLIYNQRNVETKNNLFYVSYKYSFSDRKTILLQILTGMVEIAFQCLPGRKVT